MCRIKSAAPSAVNLYGNRQKSAPTAGESIKEIRKYRVKESQG